MNSAMRSAPFERRLTRADYSPCQRANIRRIRRARARIALVAVAERNASGLLGKVIFDIHPGCFRGDHEMDFGDARGVGVKRAEPEPQDLRRGVVALVEGRAAAAREAAVDAGAGFSAGKKLVPRDYKELGRAHTRSGPEARARVLAAPPAVAVGDRSE